jgi:hypothetical protein
MTCNELFVIGKSTMSLVLNEYMYAFNDVYRDFIFWPQRGVMLIVMEDLKIGMVFLMRRAIDGISSRLLTYFIC